MKIGDLNASAVANANMPAADRTSGIAIFDLEERSVKAGETFDVRFKSAQQLKAFQFTMLLNGLEMVGLTESDQVSANNFGTFNGATAVSIDGAQEFTLRFRAEKSGKLSQMLGVSGSITRAEAYSNEGRQGIAFRFRSPAGMTVSSVGFELYQNQPNPFVNKTNVGFYLPARQGSAGGPEAAEATLSIVDESGRVVYQQKGQFAKSENSIQLYAGLVIPQGTGLLYYKLETETDSATKKMIQAK